MRCDRHMPRNWPSVQKGSVQLCTNFSRITLTSSVYLHPPSSLHSSYILGSLNAPSMLLPQGLLHMLFSPSNKASPRNSQVYFFPFTFLLFCNLIRVAIPDHIRLHLSVFIISLDPPFLLILSSLSPFDILYIYTFIICLSYQNENFMTGRTFFLLTAEFTQFRSVFGTQQALHIYRIKKWGSGKIFKVDCISTDFRNIQEIILYR